MHGKYGMHGMSAGGWGGPGGGWGGGGWGGPGGHRGRPGPPPWLGEMLGFTRPAPPKPPRARKGDVRAAILDVLAAEPMNGYQLIQQIAERSGGVWRPSPGSVYPTVQQLEDEGLVEGDQAQGRRTLRLTAEGEAYVADHPEELAAVWEPFTDGERDGRGGGDFASFMPEVGQTVSAVWQIVSTGTDEQRRQAVAIMTDARRRLYQVLADGETPADDGADEPAGVVDEGERGELR